MFSPEHPFLRCRQRLYLGRAEEDSTRKVKQSVQTKERADESEIATEMTDQPIEIISYDLHKLVNRVAELEVQVNE